MHGVPNKFKQEKRKTDKEVNNSSQKRTCRALEWVDLYWLFFLERDTNIRSTCEYESDTDMNNTNCTGNLDGRVKTHGAPLTFIPGHCSSYYHPLLKNPYAGPAGMRSKN